MVRGHRREVRYQAAVYVIVGFIADRRTVPSRKGQCVSGPPRDGSITRRPRRLDKYRMPTCAHRGGQIGRELDDAISAPRAADSGENAGLSTASNGRRRGFLAHSRGVVAAHAPAGFAIMDINLMYGSPTTM